MELAITPKLRRNNSNNSITTFKYLTSNLVCMIGEKPLYQDEKLKIEYFRNPDEHLVWISSNEHNYIMQRGILEELAKTPRGCIEHKIEAFNSLLLSVIKESGIGVDGLHVAICQAYAEEERRAAQFAKEFRGRE